MNEQLEQKLIQKYPKLLRQTGESELVSPMYWGFQCGDGWYNILDVMLCRIQSYIDSVQKVNPEYPQPEFVQIKEKFGGLRAYINGGDDVIFSIIAFAEQMSDRTCDVCGNVGKNRSFGGWYVTLCEEHSAKYKEKTNRAEDPEEDQ